MTHICFTYHMHRRSESAENCIILPIDDFYAEDILASGAESAHVKQPYGSVNVILRELATLQQYYFDGVVHVEEAKAILPFTEVGNDTEI